ncbi:unnamed protein product, partial [Allacma fusca]
MVGGLARFGTKSAKGGNNSLLGPLSSGFDPE